MIEMLIEFEPGDGHGRRWKPGDLVVEDVSVGFGVESVQILVWYLMVQPSEQIIWAIGIAGQLFVMYNQNYEGSALTPAFFIYVFSQVTCFSVIFIVPIFLLCRCWSACCCRPCCEGWLCCDAEWYDWYKGKWAIHGYVDNVVANRPMICCRQLARKRSNLMWQINHCIASLSRGCDKYFHLLSDSNRC